MEHTFLVCLSVAIHLCSWGRHWRVATIRDYCPERKSVQLL